MKAENLNKPPKPAIVGNLLLCDVPVLMARYFRNKDERKKIKIERVEYMTDKKCEGEDCIRDGTEEIDYCDVCKARHSFYLRLKKIQHENSGILRKVRCGVRHIA